MFKHLILGGLSFEPVYVLKGWNTPNLTVIRNINEINDLIKTTTKGYIKPINYIQRNFPYDVYANIGTRKNPKEVFFEIKECSDDDSSIAHSFYARKLQDICSIQKKHQAFIFNIDEEIKTINEYKKTIIKKYMRNYKMCPRIIKHVINFALLLQVKECEKIYKDSESIPNFNNMNSLEKSFHLFCKNWHYNESSPFYSLDVKLNI